MHRPPAPAARPPRRRPAAGAGLALAALLAAAAPAPRAAAGPALDAAAEAERLMAEGRVAEAAGALRAGMFALLDQAPAIGFAVVVPVEGEVEGYGSYSPRASVRYAPGEPVRLYVEPVGLAAVARDDGSLVQGFVVDLVVRDASRAVIGAAPALMASSVRVRQRPGDFFAALTYNLTGLPPGRYSLENTMRDQNSDRQGSFTFEIEVGD